MERPLNLLPEEAAERLRVSKNTLSNWRVQGRGPKFIKLGRKILYPLPELEAFEREHLQSNTTGVRGDAR